MRILLITNVFPNPYQPTKGMFNLSMARALGTDHDVRVISPISWTVEWGIRGNGDVTMRPDRREIRDGIEVRYPRYYYPPKIMRRQYGWFYWQSMCKTARIVAKDQCPEVILAYWAHPDGEAALRLGRLIAVPVVVMVGGSDVLLLTSNSVRRNRVFNVLQSADAVVAVGQDLKERLIELGIDRTRISIVARGVDTSRFTPGDQSEARSRLNIPKDTRTLLWVGRMEPVKGLDVLLEACTILRQRSVAFHLHLIGDGGLRQVLEADCRDRGLSELVSFVGPVAHEQLPDWYRAADVMVLPSRSEGVPNVLRESLACGTPFVASRVGGIPELANEAASRLVPPGDAAALAEAVGQSLAEPRNQPVQVRHAQSWAEASDALLSVIRPLLSRSTVPIPS